MAQPDNRSAHSSSVYDGQIRGTIPYYDALHRETLNLVAAVNPNPLLWLDTGCGTGTLVTAALARFPGTRFLLADPSPEMLAETIRKLGEDRTERIELLEPAPTQSLRLPENRRPDVITAIQCHHYLNEQGRRDATRVCHDLLGPGGIYMTFENIRPATEEGIAIALTNWGHFQRSAGKDEQTIAEHLARFGTEYFPISVAEHLALLRETGFKTAELFWLSHMQAGFYGIK